MEKQTELDKRKNGTFLGLAIGDALGAPVEFKARGTFEPVTAYRSGGHFNLEAGQWTDDTSMALALLDSIQTEGWNPRDQLTKYLEWLYDGKYSSNGVCFDIGSTTLRAVKSFEQTGDTIAPYDDSSLGNGCLMRFAPVSMFYWKEYLDLFNGSISFLNRCAEASATTHSHPLCVSACQYFGCVLAAFIAGESPYDVLSPDWKALKHLNLHHMIDFIVRKKTFLTKKDFEIRSDGFVANSLEAALWAFCHGRNFQEVVLLAVNLGDDADTVGAIAGQLAGAYYGIDGIPFKLLYDLYPLPKFIS